MCGAEWRREEPLFYTGKGGKRKETATLDDIVARRGGRRYESGRIVWSLSSYVAWGGGEKTTCQEGKSTSPTFSRLLIQCQPIISGEGVGEIPNFAVEEVCVSTLVRGTERRGKWGRG